MSDMLINKVVEQLRTMPDELQEEVLIYTRELRKTKRVGVPGKTLLQFAGTIPADDLEAMRQAIEDDCEQVETKSQP